MAALQLLALEVNQALCILISSAAAGQPDTVRFTQTDI
jgi:hypothetical protein